MRRRQRSHELGVRDTVEIAGQIGVHHLAMPRAHMPMDLPDGVQGTVVRPVGVLLRREVGLEDRLQDQHHRHLRHAVPDRTDTQRALLAITFRDEHTAHRVRSIRSLSQFGRQFVEPSVPPVRLDVLEGLAVHPRGAVVGATAQVGELQDVPAIHLVVQPVEPILRRSLRFGMQRRPEFLNLRWRYEAHANLPALVPLGTLILNSGPFPRPELPGFHGTTGLSATPARPGLSLAGVRLEVTRLRRLGLPVLQVSSPVSTCRCHYPGGIVGSDRSWDGLFHPFPCSPTTAAFPGYVAGRLPR